ncbi:MAG: CsgG/HfaB family protein, partial [Prevotellaceae bacterium]|nr:CsgG/HfaB family protein [Prevotellaceae bacterium]
MNKNVLLWILLLWSPLFVTAQTLDGYIIKIEGDKIYLDLHSPDVNVSDIVSVYADGEYIIHPKTKQKIRKEAEIAGRIEIENVYSAYSIGRMLDDVKIPLKEGMVVKKEPIAEMVKTSQDSILVRTVNELLTPKTTASPLPTNIGNKVAVVVAPAEVNDVVGTGYFGNYVADILMEHLLLCDKVVLLDRSVLNAQMDEVDLAEKYIDQKTAIQKGKIIGARYIVQVTMQKPDVVNTKTGVPLSSIMGAAQAISGRNMGAQYASNMGVANLKSAVSISTRVVDLQTGEIVFMCNGVGSAKGKSQLSMEYGALGGAMINGGANGFKQTITGQAIQEAFSTIGNSLNDYFSGKTDKKVVSASKITQSDTILRRKRGLPLFMGEEKLSAERTQMLFANIPGLYLDYQKAKKQVIWSRVAIFGGVGGSGLCLL